MALEAAEMIEPKEDEALPADAAMVLTALDAAGRTDRRRASRSIYRATGSLSLFTDQPGSAAREIYTRDINERGMGFVTRDRLPLGYGGVIRLPSPSGSEDILNIQCTIYRCRVVAPGWYEGSLHFNRDQHVFQNVAGNERGSRK